MESYRTDKVVLRIALGALGVSSVMLGIAIVLLRNVPLVKSNFLEGVLPFFADHVNPEQDMTLYVAWMACNAGLVLFGLWRWVKPNAVKPAVGREISQPWQWLPEAGVMAGIAVVLFVPDIEAMVARIFVGDQFQHVNSSVMAPAWAYLAGCKLDVDVTSAYGLGLPMVVAYATKIFGNFSYEHFFQMLVDAHIIYYVLWYVFLRQWLKGRAWAIIAVLAGIATQMFHKGVFPLVFHYPSTTVLRFIWDVGVFLCLWRHAQTKRVPWLFAAATLVGFAIFYLSSTGLCLLLAFGAYVLGDLWFIRRCVHWQAAVGVLLRLVWPLVTAFVLICLTQGASVWDKVFWDNLSGFNDYFIKGFGTIPFADNWAKHEYWSFAMSLIIPVGYMLSTTVLAGLLWAKRVQGDALLAAVLGVYGMLMFHYFVARSAGTSYDVVVLPFVFISVFWLSQWHAALRPSVGRWLLVVAGLIVGMMFVANKQFCSYPNVFHAFDNPMTNPRVSLRLPNGQPYFHHLVTHVSRIFGPNSLGETDEHIPDETFFSSDAQLKDFYRREFDFSPDVRLIQSLTGPQEKVALLSSFDVKILMQADRRPFFYYYPIFLPRPMHMRSFAVPAVYTYDQVKRTLRQLEEDKPAYVFIERIYSPPNMVFANPTNALLPLLMYVHTHYEPSGQGYFLVALKRK